MKGTRETFASSFGVLTTMIGVAVGLGAVWRFPYMVGRYGGAAFVLVYLLVVGLVGIPALMAEWTLGRSTHRGTLGARKLPQDRNHRAGGWLSRAGGHRRRRRDHRLAQALTRGPVRLNPRRHGKP